MNETRWALEAQLTAVRLGGHTVLHDLGVSIAAGRWTAVVGPNGAGKSTLLRTLAGLQPFDGELRLLAHPMSQWSHKARAKALAWLGQTEAGSDDLRAGDVVMLGRLPHQSWLAPPHAADHAAVQQAMVQTQCWAWRGRPMGQLSGGERQRVLLARALAVQAQVLLMDEPLSHLDPPHQADWLDTVRGLVQQGVTVVSVLHELNMALQADALLILDKGQLCGHGSPNEPEVQATLVRVFEQRIALHRVSEQWVALPCAALTPKNRS